MDRRGRDKGVDRDGGIICTELEQEKSSGRRLGESLSSARELHDHRRIREQAGDSWRFCGLLMRDKSRAV